jgi:hypothetical protein
MTDADLREIHLNGNRIAFRFREGAAPTLLFLPGYASDMDGAKALALESCAPARGRAVGSIEY